MRDKGSIVAVAPVQALLAAAPHYEVTNSSERFPIRDPTLRKVPLGT
jgi:hypothetical protein